VRRTENEVEMSRFHFTFTSDEKNVYLSDYNCTEPECNGLMFLGKKYPQLYADFSKAFLCQTLSTINKYVLAWIDDIKNGTNSFSTVVGSLVKSFTESCIYYEDTIFLELTVKDHLIHHIIDSNIKIPVTKNHCAVTGGREKVTVLSESFQKLYELLKFHDLLYTIYIPDWVKVPEASTEDDDMECGDYMNE